MPYVNLILDYLRKPSLITFQRAKGIFFFFTLLKILPPPSQILNEITQGTTSSPSPPPSPVSHSLPPTDIHKATLHWPCEQSNGLAEPGRS